MADKYFDELVNEFLQIKDKKLLENFLTGLLTPQELEEIPVRLQIVKMLKKGIPQHEISAKLGVGIATVTRGSKEIQMDRFQNIKNDTSWRD